MKDQDQTLLLVAFVLATIVSVFALFAAGASYERDKPAERVPTSRFEFVEENGVCIAILRGSWSITNVPLSACQQ